MNKFTRLFSDSDAAKVELAGGKGASLAKLVTAGFNVPPGFVVTVDAYRVFAESVGEILSGVPDFDVSRPDALAQNCNRVIAGLCSRSLPESVRSELALVLEQFGTDGRYAVRSSSTLEDLASAAFAGQHDTFLNVVGLPDIEAKIVSCFASLWGDRAILYRAAHGFDHSDVAMAVVVQQLVEAETAGVAFSLNPVTGNPDQVMINANFGLGESVVSGESDVDQYLYNVPENNLDESRIADEKRAIYTDATSGVRQKTQRGGIPCINEKQIAEVAQLAAQAADFYGQPQDIEWAYDVDWVLYLLQSRPVTNVPPYWTRDEAAERFPNVITPLTWDLVEEGFHESLRHSLSLMGMPSFDGSWFGLHENYVYGNEAAVRRYKNLAPTVPEDLETLLVKLPDLLKRFAWVLELPGQWSTSLDRYLMELGRLGAVPLDDLSEVEIWGHVLEVNDLGASYFCPNIAISMAHHILTTVMKRLCMIASEDEREAEHLFSLLLSITDTRTGQINREIFKLAEIVRHDRELSALLRSANSQQLLSSNALDAFSEFGYAFDRFLALFGNREIEFDPYHPTWGETPWFVLDQVRVVSSSSEEFNAIAELQKRIKVRETEHAFLSRLPDKIRPYAAGLLRWTRTYTELDDLEHFETSRLTPVIRRGLLALGEKLVADGIAQNPSDIWFARRATLDKAIRSGSDTDRSALRSEIVSQKAKYHRNKQKTPNWILSERDNDGPSDVEWMTGIPGSPGTIEGTVFVLHGPEDFVHFPDRAVLVARTTNPAWTPLFYSAAAIVTESGGPLSHGAVTARELGKPAVMAVPGVLELLKSGDRVGVDGTAGTVRLLD